MTFISYDFLILFAIVLSLYFLLNHRLQNFMLLIASYVFYGWWDWRFLGLIFLSSVIDYISGLILGKKSLDSSPGKRLAALTASMVSNLGLLGLFKYYDFFVYSLIRFGALFHLDLSPSYLHLILPVGISFYTFQTMSYTIDVYRRKLQPTSNFLDFLLYVSFFPQLVAGPIERAVALLPQVTNPRRVSRDNVLTGFQLMLVGFFKKMVIADNMAIVVNSVYNQANPSGAEVLFATYAFAAQIYGDFSGYTDIARGAARILGFRICENFRLPYFAINPSDFWQRWHISLSSWLRDYLYISLGGNRLGTGRTYFNLAATMLLGGLWHGASNHFVVWGAYQGFLLIIYRLFENGNRSAQAGPKKHDLWFWLQVVFYFHLTCLGWLIFRADSVPHIMRLCASLFSFTNWWNINTVVVVKVILGLVPLLAFQTYQFLSGVMEPWTRWPIWLLIPFYLLAYYAIVIFGSPISTAFIYFQF